MDGWKRDNDKLETQLAPNEAAVIRGLVGQIKDMLGSRAEQAPQDELAELTGMRTGPTTAPDDRVLARLLPDFYRTDPETGESDEQEADAAGAMRSLHEPELIDEKISMASTVLETCPRKGGRVSLTDEQADRWLSALNDVRLALGTALQVSDEIPDEPPEDELEREHHGIYHWLTWVQDSMVEAMTSE